MSNSATMDAGFLGYRQFFQAWKTHGKIDKNHGDQNKSVHRLEKVAEHSQAVFANSPENKSFLSKLFSGLHPTNILFASPTEIEQTHNEHKAKYTFEAGENLTEDQHKQNKINTEKAAKETLGALKWRPLDKLATTAITAQNTFGILADIFNIFTSDQKGTAFANLIKDSTCFIVGLLPVNSVAAQLAIQFALNYFSGFLYSIFGGLDANPGQGQQQQMAYQQSPNPNGMPAQSNYLANGLNRLSQPQSGENFSYCV